MSQELLSSYLLLFSEQETELFPSPTGAQGFSIVPGKGLNVPQVPKKKNPLEILPMIGFLTVPYDPILSMFGHSNLIIRVLPLYLYIITFFLASITQTKGETQTFLDDFHLL